MGSSVARRLSVGTLLAAAAQGLGLSGFPGFPDGA
jgi:hypothetical protein